MGYPYLILNVTESNVNVAKNTSDVTVVLSIHSDTSYNLYSPSGAVSINATSYSFTHTFDTHQTTELFRKTVTVPHANDGSATATVTAWFNTEVSVGTIYANQTKQLTKINRGATIVSVSPGSITLGSGSIKVTIDKKKTGFEYYKYYQVAGKTYTLGQFTASTGQETWAWTPPMSLSSLSPNRANFPLIVGVMTKQNGKETLRDGKTVTVTIPKSSGAVIDSAWVEVEKLYQGLCLQNHSIPSVAFRLNTSPLNGATIQRAEVTFGDQKNTISTQASLPPAYTGTLSVRFTAMKAGSIPWTVKVFDSRGNSYTQSGSQSVVAYEPPEIVSLSVTRGDADGTPNLSGANVLATYEYKYSALSVGSPTYANFYVNGAWSKGFLSDHKTGSRQTVSVKNQVVGTLDSTTPGKIRMSASDGVGHVAERTLTLPKALVLMDFSKNGVGIGVPAVDGYCTFDESILPVRGLFEEGSNANGHYLKFDNGILICWMEWSIETALQQPYGGLYISDHLRATYPHAFSSPPVCVIGRARWETGASFPIICVISKTDVQYWVADYYERASIGTVVANAIAIGRWK